MEPKWLEWAESLTDLLQGTLDLLVLKALAPGPLHGLGVSHRIEQITKGTFLRSSLVPFFPLYTAWKKRVGSSPLGASLRTIAGLGITV